MGLNFLDMAASLYPAQQDLAYRIWMQKYGVRESDDYDTYGAFKAGLTPDERGHLDDRYKKDNHITYSIDSIASQKGGAKPAGEWVEGKNNQWTFKAVSTNVDNAGGEKKLKEYFDMYEPDAILVLPSGEKYTPKAK